MRWYQRLSTKLAVPIVLAVGGLILLVGFMVTQYAYSRFKQEADDKRQAKMDDVYQNLEATDRLMVEQAKAAMRVFKREGIAVGMPSLNGQVKVGEETVPNLMFGATAQTNNPATVDKVQELVGGTASLLVRSGDSFVRVTTNLEFPDKRRAVGVPLDPLDKAITSIRQGRPHYGVTYIFDRPYITGYEPIQDSSGNTIGIWNVSYLLTSLEEIARSNDKKKVLEQGFVALVDDRGQVIFKPPTASEGMIKKAIALSEDGKIDDWNVKKTVYAPWGYTIVSAYSDNDPQLAGQIFYSRLIIFGSSMVVIALLALFVVWLTRKYTSPLSEAVQAAEQIAQGKIKVGVAVKSDDEIGQLGQAMRKMIVYLQEMSGVADRIAEGNLKVEVKPKSDQDRFGLAFKNMLERTLRLVQTQDERDRLQSSIVKLLDEVAEVGQGDLTTQAEVTPDATGAIADAFNYMIEELRNIVYRVQTTTIQVDTSATEVRLTSETLTRNSEVQSQQLSEAALEVEHLAASIQQIAENVNVSTQVADRSLNRAQKSTESVENNINAMNRIRVQAQGTADRLRRLGERSQEIGKIVKLIDELARRTSMVAMNASIQATAGGEAGRGFVVVAEEIERLAERSADATKQIAALTKAIQGETNEAISSMQNTLSEVQEGSKLANEVGQALREIQDISRKMSELNRSILSATTQQGRGSEALQKTISRVSTIAQKTTQEMRQSAMSVEKLTMLAQELRSSVASFKLPESFKEKKDKQARETNFENSFNNEEVLAYGDELPGESSDLFPFEMPLMN